MTKLMAMHCGQSYEKVMEDTERDRFLTAEDSVEYGLVDRIVQNRAEELNATGAGADASGEGGAGGGSGKGDGKES